MKTSRWALLGLAIAALSAPGYCAYEHSGTLGINYTVGPSFIAGGDGATSVSSVEPGVGTGLLLRTTRNLDLKMDYDYIDADIRSQALTFGGNWRLEPGRRGWDPFVGAGLGFGKPVSGASWGHFAFKLIGGLEKMMTPDLGLAGTLTYEFVNGPDPFGSVHVVWPGIRLTYYFANLRHR